MNPAADSIARDQLDLRRSALRTAIVAATCTLVGALASGPLALWVLGASHAQPAWQDARTFAANYHSLQALPFFLGLLLVAGFVVLIASLHTLASASLRPRTQSAVIFTSVFAALVLFNYALQTTFVPGLVVMRDSANDPLLAALTMTNPRSLGWTLEMWGYGWLGVATWLVAPVFHGAGLERAARWAFVANGPLSVVGALWTALQPGWVMTTPGMVAFAAWNVLVVAMAALAMALFRARAQDCSTAAR
jgi:MFS family permease